MLFENFPRRRTRHIHRHVAAADHHNLLTDVEPVTQIGVQQEINTFMDTVQIDSGNGKIPAPMRPDRQNHRIETLFPQFMNREIAARGLVDLQRHATRVENLTHLTLNHAAR